ncbi:MAG TPA: short-chain dehydrogenase, partial [Marinobacter adhaerens]|nr:short-chain dehydrogenase [Marinobacter adhaerens]
MSDRLQETSNIWITGASSGIGESVTRALARGGHRLVITGRRPGGL